MNIVDKIEELHNILDLLKKHDLPISPILEYAIKEREEEYKNAESTSNREFVLSEPQPILSVRKDISDYANDFANLSVGSSGGKKLPHKAILLTCIMSLIERGQIENNKVLLDKHIKNEFDLTWSKYFDKAKVPSVWTPFWYMKSESFWHFKEAESMEMLQTLLRFAGHPSIGQMRSVIKYAYFDNALFAFMKDNESQNILKKVLLENYL